MEVSALLFILTIVESSVLVEVLFKIDLAPGIMYKKNSMKRN